MSLSETFAVDSRLAAPRLRPVPPAPPTPPDIVPGQLWLVEAPAAKAALSAPTRHALEGVNVVIYDRALSGRLAGSLPLGTYAEPAHDGDAAAVRCVRFARDGWSVVRLMPPRLPQRDRTRHVRDFVAALEVARVAGSLPARILAEAAYGIREETTIRLDRLADAVATYDRDTRLAIVIDAFGGAAAGLSAVAANGLAG